MWLVIDAMCFALALYYADRAKKENLDGCWFVFSIVASINLSAFVLTGLKMIGFFQ